MGGLVSKLIHRNSTIPASATETFTTAVEGQRNVLIHVVQGEREMVKDCRSLARFDLKDIVIGPQGVIEIATMRGTQRGAWQGQAATGRKAELDIVIHFPWDPSADRFAGERIYYDSGAFTRQLGDVRE